MNYDAIVIGSGLGGLTTASLLTRFYGKKVLVLERHFKQGGFTHVFARAGGYHWDVGIHYVGDLADGSFFKGLFRLVCGDGLRWQKMPDPFDNFWYPGVKFGLRTGEKSFREDLLKQFPDEGPAIRRYFKDIKKAPLWMVVTNSRGVMPAPLRALASVVLRDARKLAETTTGEYLATRFRDPKLRAVLASQWGDYGEPPSRSSFCIHSVVATHYLNGGFYPVGSSKSIGEGALKAIRAGGGDVRMRAHVERVLVEGGRAVGVRLAGGEELRAPLVISNAGARNTYLKLLGDDTPIAFRDELRAVPTGFANVTLYLGLKDAPTDLGVKGGNYWMFDSFDHDAIDARRDELLEGKAHFAFLSFPSMKDPLAKAHTAEIIAPVSAELFAKWRGGEWKKKGEEYQALKDRIADTLIAFVEERLPGFAAKVAYREVSTPLSTEYFTDHAGGEIYGFPSTPARLRSPWIGAATPVRGLYLTGADACAHGIGGALMGGLICTAAIEGVGAFWKIGAAASRAAEGEETAVVAAGLLRDTGA